VISITGETRCYNGLEVDGVGAVGIPGGINYRFCAVCGSSLYCDMVYPPTGQRFFTIALGSFVDPVFPPPTTEFFTKFRRPGCRRFLTRSRSMTRWVRTPKRHSVRLIQAGGEPTHNCG
jgi:hypothetical protein